MTATTSLWTKLLDVLAPRFCAACGQRLAASEEGVCAVCQMCLPYTDYWLSPTDNPMARLFWGQAPVDRAAALFHYAPKTDAARLIHDLKYHDQPELGRALGRMAAQVMGAAGFFDGIDLLVPVPLTRWRRWQRGYNQSREIAEGIAAATGIAVGEGALRRRSFRDSQTRQTPWQRRDNVEGAFAVDPRRAALLAHRHVLLVDDVVTTGSTCLACAKAIAEAVGPDAAHISVLSLGVAKRD